ncbi:hypothetical protein N9S39_00225 [Candidatus Pelagibacter sp.]|nr:hypothetical protein [Candidatus Pelagibacter sp.]
MIIKKRNIIQILLISFFVYSTTLIWNFVVLPFNENSIIDGQYLLEGYHALNDPLRYLNFILIPLIGYLLIKIIFEKKRINFSYLNVENKKSLNTNSKLYIASILVISLLFFEFLSISFQTTSLDIFHSGIKLSSSFKGSLDGSLWSGSYVTSGIIQENLGSRFIWYVLDHQSIGAARYVELLFVFIFKVLLIFLIYEITKKSFVKDYFKLFYFLIISLMSLFLIDYDLTSADSIAFRDIPIILSLIIFFKYLNNIDKNFLLFILLGSLSVMTFFWSIDRGLIINFLLVFICVYLFVNNKYNNIYIILLSAALFWTMSYFILGNEFNLFLDNTFSIFKNAKYVYGIIHPTPFSDMPNSARATKSLLLILLSILISFSFLFTQRKKYNTNFKIIIITLSFIGFCSYMHALGRADGGHIKKTEGILFIIFSLLIVYNLIKKFEKNLLNNKIHKYLFYSINLILMIAFLFTPKINIENILEYPQRFKRYVYLPDEFFLSKEQNKFVKEMTPIVENYKCVQLFTNDSALLYLLRKPNCGRYYVLYQFRGSLKEQNLMIEEMKDANVVIYSGQTDDWGIPPKKKLPLVDEYINSNFLHTIKLLSWEVKLKPE